MHTYQFMLVMTDTDEENCLWQKKGCKAKKAESSLSSAEEDSSIPAQGQPSTLVDTLADVLSEIEVQSSSNESAPPETSGAVTASE